jgi:glycosyltransferase involved in cell wall biosynthesis
MKVLLIGPFPLPVDGCSFANEILYQNLEKRKVLKDRINTNTAVVSSKQGQSFSLQKAFSFLGRYAYVYKIFNSDVVYVTPGQTFFGIMKYSPFLWLCQLLSKPYIIHVHGNYLGEEYKRLSGIKKSLFKRLISNASAGIVLSKSLVKNFKSLLPDRKVFIVENFVSNALYHQKAIKKTDKLRIVYLSNLIKEKGIIDLLDALILLDSYAVDFDAVLAGVIDTADEHAITMRLKKLKGKVSYIGVVSGDNKRKILWDANVFVLPTYYIMEGQPIALLEGLATGNIIVTTKHSGIPDIIDERNGFFVPVQSPASIAACLKKISDDLQRSMNTFSQYNIKYAAEKFTEDNFTNKVLGIIQSV